MRKGIVVASCARTASTWLADCLDSLADVPFGVTVAWSTPERNEFDVSALRVGVEQFDEFWMLPDSTIVHDVGLMLATLSVDGLSCSLGAAYLSCIGKVCSADARRVGLPKWPRTKMEAVEVELGWFRRYAFSVGAQTLDRAFTDGPKREWRHGRQNMVLESSVLTKFKGTWTLDMVAEVDAALAESEG